MQIQNCSIALVIPQRWSKGFDSHLLVLGMPENESN